MVLLNLALDALNELFRLYENDKPLWVSSLDGGGETLNIKKYARLFTPLIGTKPEHFTREATRESGTVADTSLALVNTLLDKCRGFFRHLGNCREEFVTFSASVDERGESSPKKKKPIRHNANQIQELETLDGGGETLNIKEYARLFTPLIGTKPEHFTTEATRALGIVADTSLALVNTLMDKVTWIEHMEYNENLVHDWYRPLIKTGLGFGAHRWMATLQRQHQFLKVMKSIVDPIGGDSGANRVILQDICMDATGSLLVYATIDSQEINTVLKWGKSSCVTLFSNGIAMVPDCFQDFSTTNNYNVISGKMNNGFNGVSLVTISFQMMGNIFLDTTISMELVKEANALISHTIHKIKSALKCR
ncbi:hypothetical protein MTR67_027074 [Solanum verrucosum]|uniref:START domain-containing protein n=1 Tax=Solanum verrucosum TaxID=315347 RepID=A0AAF0R037_SOLVR|nr:hypothetical protein MTR67_027074 [Solanum verrucosum]